MNGDVVEGDELEAALEAAREFAARAATDLRAGRIRACPDSCTPNGGCAYPAVCRAGDGMTEEDAA